MAPKSARRFLVRVYVALTEMMGCETWPSDKHLSNKIKGRFALAKLVV